MICASALSTAPESATALREVVDRVSAGLGGSAGSLAVAFVSPHHAGAVGSLAKLCRDRGIAERFLAVTGETIVGDGREVEGSAERMDHTTREIDNETTQQRATAARQRGRATQQQQEN